MSTKLSSETVTEGVRVRAAALYLPDQSQPAAQKYLFAYRISIINEGTERVRLLSRHWVIINGSGDREDVGGPGVVGKFPSLAPGEQFEYTSFCPLDTEWGTMEGSFRMQREDGETFDAIIGRFFLATTARPMVEEA
ncbi:MAG: Co2+/Mg2+ efflux protein ApaG [Ignavibacteria bacterium]